MKLKYVTIFLVLLCCLMGAASAAEDVSTDVVNDAIDNVIISDEDVDADLQSGESSSLEAADTDSGVDQSDASIETNDEEENIRASGTQTVSTWSDLKTYAETTGTDYTINLNGPISISTGDIEFKNNAIVVGNANSYITGNAANRIPFKSTYNNALQITFRNVKFQNINCQMLIQLQTTGTSKLENCTFMVFTEVPDVVNLDYREAKNRLQKAGFIVDIENSVSSSVTKDYVISTSPMAGEQMSSGSTVYVVVSTGPQTSYVRMPNVIGLSEEAAISRLESAGLSYGGSDRVYSDVDAGTVIGQSSDAFTEIEEHSKIALKVSLGPQL